MFVPNDDEEQGEEEHPKGSIPSPLPQGGKDAASSSSSAPIEEPSTSGEWHPLPEPVELPTGKARRLSRRKKDKDQDAVVAQVDGDAPMGIFGLFNGSKKMKKIEDQKFAVPAVNAGPLLFETDQESTDVGSGVDSIDTDGDDSWEPLDSYQRAMKIEFQSYEEKPAPRPRGVCPVPLPKGSKPKSTSPQGDSAEAPGASEDTERLQKKWDQRARRDLAHVSEDSIPDLAVPMSEPMLHRGKIHTRKWPVNACVARPVSKRELEATPAATKEWGGCYPRERLT